MVSSTNHLSQLRKTSFFHHRPETASAEIQGDNISPVWRGWGACSLCSLGLWSLFHLPYRIPSPGAVALWVSSWHCCTNPRGVLAGSQGGVTDHQAPLHKMSPGLRWHKHPPAAQHHERGLAPCQGWPWAGVFRELDTAWLVDTWSTSVSCAVHPSQHQLKYSPKIPGSRSALSCLPCSSH